LTLAVAVFCFSIYKRPVPLTTPGDAGGQKVAANEIDPELARSHEIGFHRHLLHAAELKEVKEGFKQIELKLTVSSAGDVERVSADSSSGAMQFWPSLQKEVQGWKFRPFEINGKPVETQVSDYINIVPAERLPKVHVTPPDFRSDSKFLIKLGRSGCMGTCPAYDVEIHESEVVFLGYSYVVAPGRHIVKLNPVQTRALVRRFIDSDFYSMAPKYVQAVTDCPTYTLSIEIDGHRKQVIDYVGEEVGMPQSISDLEEAVDNLAGTDRWIRGESLIETLRAEQYNFNSFDAQVIAKLAAMRGKIGLFVDLLKAGVPADPLPPPSLPSSDPLSYLDGYMAKVGWLNAAFSHPEILQIAMQRGLGKEDQRDKDIALAGAAEMGDVQTSKKLIAYGANPNADLSGSKIIIFKWREDYEQDGAGSILIYAANSGNPEMVREILQYQPKLNAKDGRGRTALFVVGEHRYADSDVDMPRCIELLASAGIDVNARDAEGMTALHRASDKPIAEVLLAHGANPNLRDEDGETPLFKDWNSDIEELLLAHGADPDIRNKKGRTAFQALELESPEQARVLRALIAKHRQPLGDTRR